MNTHQLIRGIREENQSKIVLLVADGLGGLPVEPGGLTELETARTPNFDQCLREGGVCGLSVPVLPGITPGSGPGHLGLFGYDPLEHKIGRGVLEALGINFAVGPKDVAIRGNFCTVDASGTITDRRAGRPSNDRCQAMCNKLKQIKIPALEVYVEPVREHRLVLVLRGESLGDQVNDTDPQVTGQKPLAATGQDPASQNTARAANQFIASAGQVLKSDAPTNMVTLRGFARYPKIESFQDVYGLRAAALAVYPMYKGLARLVGMDVLDCGANIGEQIGTLRRVWGNHDFFFIHFKYTDSTGEDGAFAKKVEMIEKLDTEVPKIRELNPNVFIVTGDHSTPSKLKSHSWHPVPVLLWARTCRPDGETKFGEGGCLRGGLGRFEAKHLMTLAMAHALRLGKYGA
jgi:2,3-bisphosphoglycerate-independent phosphoglycerate mutase